MVYYSCLLPEVPSSLSLSLTLKTFLLLLLLFYSYAPYTFIHIVLLINFIMASLLSSAHCIEVFKIMLHPNFKISLTMTYHFTSWVMSLSFSLFFPFRSLLRPTFKCSFVLFFSAFAIPFLSSKAFDRFCMPRKQN